MFCRDAEGALWRPLLHDVVLLIHTIKGMKKLFKIVPFLLVAAIFVAIVLYPKAGNESEALERKVVEVWNVDTFEGGKGSRTAFLSRVARRAERECEGVWYFVTSYSPEGARAALAEGKMPDLISFGIGLPDFMECCLAMPYHFAGGEVGGNCLAVPWCRGKYTLFSLTESFEDEGETVISCGGENLSAVAAAFAGIEGEEAESSAAYVSFLNGEYRYLLGTQRDACRFQSRGTQFYTRELPEFCDLFQYISVLSAQKKEECLHYIEILLSDDVQDSLSDIGMLPAGEAEGCTVSAFISDEAREELLIEARKGDVKILEKFLKTI